jgi:(S)-3,5-dihydroxyphenylglycine transaminase
MDGAAAPLITPLRLDAGALHRSATHPDADAMTFLNEIMARYPDAISFAPGAPHESFFGGIDIAALVDRFVTYLRESRRLDEQAVRRTLYQYGPSRGIIVDLLAAALAHDLGMPVDERSLVVTVGAQEGLLLTLRVLCGGADTVAVVDPSHVGITGAARLLDLPVVGIPDHGDGPDLGRLRAACAAHRVRVLYVAPDYANPGGTRMSLTARHELLAAADELDLLLVEDGAYAFTAGPDDLPPLKALDTAGRVVHVGTFAKIGVPGARVGYVLADQPVAGGGVLADALCTVKSMLTVNTSPIGQAVIGGLILQHDGSLRALARAKATLYRRNLTHLLGALRRHVGAPAGRTDGVTWNEPDGGFFVRMRLPVEADPALLERSAGQYGVLWTPMRAYYVGDGGARELRLACSYLSPGEIDEGAARLARLLTDVCPDR